MTVGLLLATGLVAVGDWFAVAQQRFRIEFLLKPLTLLLLVIAAAMADLGPGQTWIVLGLVFGLVGDLALLFSGRDTRGTDTPFLVGLGAFLLGNACYVVGFLRHGVHPIFLAAGLLIVGGAATLTLPSVLAGAHRAGELRLSRAVAAYAAVLGLMAICAVGTSAVLTAVGGLLFLASDTILGYDRFVARLMRGRVMVIVSYHLAQLLIVVGLLR